MRDVVPQEVADALRDHFIAGIARAESGYRYAAADEDALTGALGQSLLKPTTRLLTVEGVVSFAVSYYKVRGRGAGAPERQTGADGIFEIAVRRSDGRLIRAKGLPFQAKKNWRQRDRDLQQQASQMLQTLGTGLVIDYSTKGYAACKAEDAVELQGDRSSISRARRIRPLNQTLGNDFVNCDIGRVGLYYDPEREIFVSEEEAFQAIEGQLHVVDAKVLKPF